MASDKVAEALIGVSITGLVSAVVWLFKWCDRLDLECHDLRRDVAHLQRGGLSHSAALVESDKEYERFTVECGRRFGMTDRRMNRIELRLNSLFSRRSSDVQIVPDE